MLLEFHKTLRYNLTEETKIETVCGGLYRGQDLELGRTVAVKCTQIPGDTPAIRRSGYEKARSEVQALVRIAERNVRVPRVYTTHYDEEASVFYIVMEWIQGTTLAQRTDCSERQFLRYIDDLCYILDQMEHQRLYHKDIKPQNLMITREDRLCLIDFNISLSTPNQVEGTLHYRAPEMTGLVAYAGREKVDMFAIGVMLYEYYTSAVPVLGVDYDCIRRRGPLQWDRFIEPKDKNPKISDEMNSIIMKCMAMNPKQRYSRVSELKAALREAGKRIGK